MSVTVIFLYVSRIMRGLALAVLALGWTWFPTTSTAASGRRETAGLNRFALVHDCSRRKVFGRVGGMNNPEQPRTVAANKGTPKNGEERGGSLRDRCPPQMQKWLILKALDHVRDVNSEFPRILAGIRREKNCAATNKEREYHMNPIESNLSNNGRPGRNPIVLTRGLASVTIRYEQPRGARKAWRLEWLENSVDRSEMYDCLTEATTHAEAKLAALSSGTRTLSKAEIDTLFGFKSKVEQFEVRLAIAGRTLDQVVSDVIAAHEILPGWTVASMAASVRETYGVENRMTVKQVEQRYLAFMKSGYKRQYSAKHLISAKTLLDDFAAKVVVDSIEQVTSEQAASYINRLRVKPCRRSDRSEIGEDGLVPAARKTRANNYTVLNQMFKYAKKVLKALPPRIETVFEVLGMPTYDIPDPEVYTPPELLQIFGLCEDQEEALATGFQAFAGLRPCEVAQLKVEDIVRDPDDPHIDVSEQIAKKASDGSPANRSRPAPITEPLAALLDQVQLPKSGRIFRSRAINSRLWRVVVNAGFVWKFDALRHSFVSYRLRKVKNRAQVAYEAGHEIDMQKKHYERLVIGANVPIWWSFRFDISGLPFSVNHEVVGTKIARAHKRARRQSQALQELAKAA